MRKRPGLFSLRNCTTRAGTRTWSVVFLGGREEVAGQGGHGLHRVEDGRRHRRDGVHRVQHGLRQRLRHVEHATSPHRLLHPRFRERTENLVKNKIFLTPAGLFGFENLTSNGSRSDF